MTVLVGGSFLAVAVAPHRTAPAQATLLVTLATWLVAVLAGLEWPLLLYVSVLLVEVWLVAVLLPVHERVRPFALSIWLALPTLALLAAVWPRGRRHLGIGVGLCAAYLGVSSYAFLATWAAFEPRWSILCVAWAVAVAVLSLVAPTAPPAPPRGRRDPASPATARPCATP